MSRFDAFLILILAAGAAAGASKADLTLSDTNGKRVRLKDYRGQNVVLNFWATWCAPCRQEMPMIVEAAKEYGARGIVFIGASLDQSKTRRNVPEFIGNYKIDFPVWMDAAADDLVRLSQAEAVPATIFIDKEGTIVARVQGQIRKAELIERLDWLVGDRLGPAPQQLVTHLTDSK